MSGCRSGAVLGGPSICRAPVLSEDDAEALGVSPKWCADHAAVLARVKREVGGRPSKRKAKPAPKPEPPQEPQQVPDPREVMAQRLAAVVREREGCKGPELAEALDTFTNARVFRAARTIAVARGWVHSRGPKGYGVGPSPNAAPPDDGKPATQADVDAAYWRLREAQDAATRS